MIDKTERIVWFDSVRSLATILIVLDHAVMIGYKMFYDYFLEFYKTTSLFTQIMFPFLFQISRIGVPLFLMLTGALILTKKFESIDDIINFYKKNVFPLFVLNIIWVFVYGIIFYVTEINGIEYIYLDGFENFKVLPSDIIEGLTFQTRALSPNMWYIPMITGLYLFLPYVSILVNKFDLSQLSKIDEFFVGIPLLLVIIFCFVYNDVNSILEFFSIKYRLKTCLALSYSAGILGFYIFLGFFIRKNIDNIKKYIVFFTGVLVLILFLTVTFMRKSYLNDLPINVFVGNNSFLQMLVSAIIFCLLSFYFKYQFFPKIITLVAKKSMAIFLLHYPVMLLLNHLLLNKTIWMNYGSTKYVLLLFILTFMICFLMSLLIPKNRIIRKYIFHIS